jgi:glycosyltransferase involved in cell wall biosynthesis
MKFLFLSGHAHLAFDPATRRASGGAELQVALLARELTAAGHQVVLLGADTGQADGGVSDGVIIRNGGRFDTGAPRDTLQAWPRVREILRQEKPDFVVIYGWTTWLYLLCHLRRALGFRLVFVCALDAEIDGDFRRQNPVRGFFFDRGMRLSDARLAITEHQAALFRAQGMPCSVTRLMLQRHEFYEGPKSVDLLWVARCHPVKRPHLFLDLAERLPEATCRMICSLQDKALWEDVRRRAAGRPNVEFVDSVPYREIQDHFNAARIFVNTSSHEGVPNTFIHSGLGGTAILSLAIDPDGMFEHFQAGCFAGGDFERFAAEGKKLLENPAELTRAQQECARFVREWHDNQANLEAFLRGVGA